MAVTVRDVAEKAGVSVATVSRALNQSGRVSAQTRERVARVVAELKYRPNTAARSLITRRTGMLGVLLPDLYGEFFSELIRGLDSEAQARGFHLLLSSSHDHASEIETALNSMQARVDGLIVMAPAVEAHVLRLLVPHDLPVVLLNCALRHESLSSLAIDNYGGAYAAVQHLLTHGHTRIALVQGPPGNHDALERQRGYHAALADACLAIDRDLEMPGDFTASGGYAAALRLMALASPPTAIFATNDATAIGAMSALRDSGIAVPEQVALVGFDNVSSTKYMIPPLTTVEVSISEFGALAVTRLVAVLERADEPERRETLAARVVVRRSCGCDGGAGDANV
ncbi:MAG: LacI family DNA-binding transcriptional regulator [Gemmatimonadota bacterium]